MPSHLITSRNRHAASNTRTLSLLRNTQPHEHQGPQTPTPRQDSNNRRNHQRKVQGVQDTQMPQPSKHLQNTTNSGNNTHNTRLQQKQKDPNRDHRPKKLRTTTQNQSQNYRPTPSGGHKITTDSPIKHFLEPILESLTPTPSTAGQPNYQYQINPNYSGPDATLEHH